MKLIDILVRELPKHGGWPEGVALIDQARDGMIFDPTDPVMPYLFDSYMFELAEDWDVTQVTRAQYDAAIAAAQQPVWNGEGLPPVGMKVEWWSEKYGWLAGTVAAHDAKYPLTAIIRHNDGYTGCVRGEIRSAAYKKREDVAKALVKFLDTETDIDNVFSVRDVMGFYDAIAAGKIPHIQLK